MKTLNFRYFFKCVTLFLFFAFNLKLSYSQNLSVTFEEGFIGTIGQNAQKCNGILNFSTLGISYASFTQEDSDGDGDFNIQGNDIPGRIKFVFDDGSFVDLEAGIIWRVNSAADGFGVLIRPNDSPEEYIQTISYTSTKTIDLYSGKTQDISSNVVLIVAGRGYTVEIGRAHV